MKNTYNYKNVFNHPVTLYRIGDFSLPFGIGLARTIIAIVIFLIMLIFRDFFNALAFISGLQIVMYIGIPFFLSGYIMKDRKSGKKVHYELYDLFHYFFTIYIPRKKFANDEEVLYTDMKKVTFEEVKIKQNKEGAKHEVENTSKNRTPQFDVNEVG
ncbi:TcpE family conjugal transfer membrane protein [Virgibacillus salexigens]|uniref:Conjugal transfer protein n=1 Tax=Virgibacillus kapii TaxID=1638645 RepID=A0ABQ2DY79_9BACI|nr:TcpE family conjugal transfer membrane protein [Virgibacillus kapii]GGJ77657.1 hypothetical protein GCM10007111_44050 [Virgibacillus kapii]